MKLAVIDTDILSWFFRGHEGVVSRFSSYLAVYDKINLSIITYYEILSGLKYKDARKQLSTFLAFAKCNNIILLTEESVARSAEVYAQMRRQGTPVDDIDLLIAGVALVNDWVLVTHNTKHFGQIPNLQIEDWYHVGVEPAVL
ncbi:PilT protein domain-containing protein [Thioploca ingrica]|uniref:PilT protein domain-containing protein n=1 Tax=Thioploca ingrica TaxID=40754 RepID=A0A090AIX2_9GAMM|nr:PilT protein domain-containing protein [Thioploca ingrica]